jgi:hypothetical protein
MPYGVGMGGSNSSKSNKTAGSNEHEEHGEEAPEAQSMDEKKVDGEESNNINVPTSTDPTSRADQGESSTAAAAGGLVHEGEDAHVDHRDYYADGDDDDEDPVLHRKAVNSGKASLIAEI